MSRWRRQLHKRHRVAAARKPIRWLTFQEKAPIEDFLRVVSEMNNGGITILPDSCGVEILRSTRRCK